MIVTEFKCKAKYGGEGTVVVSFYAGGGIALQTIDENTGEPIMCATVNLAPYGSRPLLPNEVWLKGWSENEGVPAAMEECGAVRLTQETMLAGFAEAELAIVDPSIMELIENG